MGDHFFLTKNLLGDHNLLLLQPKKCHILSIGEMNWFFGLGDLISINNNKIETLGEWEGNKKSLLARREKRRIACQQQNLLLSKKQRDVLSAVAVSTPSGDGYLSIRSPQIISYLIMLCMLLIPNLELPFPFPFAFLHVQHLI